jgi:Zn-dependent peptidase ImmA (M78 family)
MTKLEAIKARADALIRREKSRDPIKIAEAQGIAVRRKDLGESIAAYYFCQSRIRSIVLSESLDPETLRIIAAHELGHDTLHRELLRNRAALDTGLFMPGSSLEYEANLFAAELLIEDKQLFALLREGEMSFFEVASRLNVPPELLDFKLRFFPESNIHTLSPILAEGNFLRKYRLKNVS